MSRIDNCTVQLESDRTLCDVSVLFKDNGWVRVGKARPYQYYPRRRVRKVTSYTQSSVPR